MAGEYHYMKNKFLREMFPKQFDTIPHIIIWALVFILDVVLVFVAAHLIGLPLPGKVGLMLYLCVAFALFCLESYLYNLIKH